MINPAQIEVLLKSCLKPDEISAHDEVAQARIEELLRWFVRYADKKANPKWLAGHAFELAYYIANNSVNKGINISKIKQKAWLEGVNISDVDRDMLIRHKIIESVSPQSQDHKPNDKG